MHISQAMGPYIDLSLARDWVHMLKHIKQYPIENGTELDPNADEDMIYQVTEIGVSNLIHLFNLATLTFVPFCYRFWSFLGQSRRATWCCTGSLTGTL